MPRGYLKFNALLRAAVPVILLAALVAPTLAGAVSTHMERQEAVDFGWGDVVRQSQENSCGPALLATLLNRTGTPVDESELISAADLGPTGITFGEFSRLAARYGIAGNWFLSRNRLLRSVEPPAVLHLARAGGHFILFEERAGSYGLVTDPARGRGLYPLSELEATWTGYLFQFVTPESELATDG